MRERQRLKPGTWVLDLGYGSGAHAIKQFLPKGYQVDFFDYSNRIADQLKLRLQDAVEATDGFSESDYRIITPTNIEELPEILKLSHYSSLLRASYRLVFADAVLFHISKVEIPKILRCFYDLLSSDGLLFANFKVNDHTMIGIDGRFFEYYANYEEIQRMLEDAGFVMEDVTFTSKSWSMYGSPYPTQWAHFICTKRPKP